ncbi:MAG: response regulator transcription factor [Chloroflexi bacterium]|nr:response regulator transcription factor [Chloroflexota bacterium]
MPKKKKVISRSKILWVEGRWNRSNSFVPTLRNKGFNVDSVSTGKEALTKVKKENHALVVVDAASMRTSGKRICLSLREQLNGKPILLICDPKRQAQNIEPYANVVLTLPFTARKLVNRINPLMPGDSGRKLKAGPVRLNLERKQVTCYGKKTSLTPRLVRLLRMLIEAEGEVVDREELFKKVWVTEYTGDTRTLDVHISWLRRAIEKDPRKPKILKTIRGVGYRLDV